MKALVKRKAEPGLWLEEVPVPEVGDDDVLIRIRKTSICGTDVHIYNWDAWSQKTIPVPMVIGHEFVGVVERVGGRVKGFAPGDLVTGEGHIVCGHCRNCLAGRRHLCPNTEGVGSIARGRSRSSCPSRCRTSGTPIRTFRSMSFPVSIR
jgi:threonine 3-dehydrogenase